jgi:hypothetical protein
MQGWRAYEARWEFPDFPGNHLPVPAPRLRSIGEASGRRVLLWHEQGLGDMILMLRFVPAVVRVARSVVIAVQPPLKQMAASLPGVERVITDGDTFEDVDCQSPLMSLPYLLRTRIATIPARVPYIAPPPDLVDVWRERLGATRNLRVGLVWRGNPAAPYDSKRSIPATALAPLLALPGIEYHVLEYQLDDADAAFLATWPAVHTYAGQLPDLAYNAALALAMDVIVTVDTAMAHLAGALGLPVWIALSADAYWVWMAGRDDSPWYPTARLFRQSTPGDWTPVIDRLRDALWQKRPSIIL